jgi:hypothetical protein
MQMLLILFAFWNHCDCADPDTAHGKRDLLLLREPSNLGSSGLLPFGTRRLQKLEMQHAGAGQIS